MNNVKKQRERMQRGRQEVEEKEKGWREEGMGDRRYVVTLLSCKIWNTYLFFTPPNLNRLRKPSTIEWLRMSCCGTVFSYSCPLWHQQWPHLHSLVLFPRSERHDDALFTFDGESTVLDVPWTLRASEQHLQASPNLFRGVFVLALFFSNWGAQKALIFAEELPFF